MPQFVRGNLWDEIGVADVVLVTTNSVVMHYNRPNSPNCELVMGAGSAREARERYPNLPHALGRLIALKGEHLGVYGVIIPPPVGVDPLVGAFQTKVHWKKPSELSVIEYSTFMLFGVAKKYRRVALPFPGINHGKLTRDEVLPLLSDLPDNVIIYERQT